MYELEEIRAIPLRQIVDLLGLPVKRMGGMDSILCPFHVDEHYGSAFLYENGMKCFACGEWADGIGLYQQVMGVSFSKAVEELAQEFRISPAKEKSMPFTPQELKRVGLLPSRSCFVPVSYEETKVRREGMVTIPDVEGYMICRKNGQSPYMEMKNLYFQDKELFLVLLLNKCKEKYQSCKNFLSRYPDSLEVKEILEDTEHIFQKAKAIQN